jgi:large subunit ribosomal protein L25
MQQVELNVVPRNTGIKSSTKKLRAEGLVPANIYGPGLKNESCAFSEKEIRSLFKSGFDSNYILNLKAAAGGLNGKKVIIKSIERDSVTWKMLHADLYEISFDRPLTVNIPFHYNGIPDGVKNSGGILQVVRRSVQIRALPNDIPDAIEVDISSLGLGTSLHLGDVKFSDKIEVLDSKGFTLVSVVEAEKEEEVKPVVAAAEGTATAAGTGTATAAGTGTATAAGTAAAAPKAGEKPPAKK